MPLAMSPYSIDAVFLIDAFGREALGREVVGGGRGVFQLH